MKPEQAKAQVHEFLCQRIKVTRWPEPPDNLTLYEFNPTREYLFTFKLLGHDSVGASEFIAVDRESGEIRYLGFLGE